MQATAEARNVGPVERITIPVLADGGIVVFRGRNGSGKSTVLDTIDAAITGKGRPPVRDGALRGEFEGFGVRLTIGRSTRRTGEAEVHSLEGRFSVADLVDPGVVDPEKADAHRIKALAALVGARADPALFHELLGGPAAFDAIVGPSALTHTDLIPMAAAVKRDVEAAARKSADEAGNAFARADAARKSAEGIDVEQESDSRTLQAELETAVRDKAKIEAEQAHVKRQTAQAEHSRATLVKMESEYTGPTPEAAQLDLVAANERYREAAAAIDDAKERLRMAQNDFQNVVGTRNAKEQAAKAADSYAKAVAFCREQIDAAANLPPLRAGDLIRATAAVAECRDRLEYAALVRRARGAIAEAKAATVDAEAHQARADRLRAAARGVDDVLSGVVAKAGVPLKIEPVENRLRLTLDTRRGRTCFGELSDGERWQLALAIATQAVGRGGELTIPQHAFEGLDPTARAAIAQQLRDAGVIAYTAEAADGELRAEVFNGEGVKE
jgi:ABC-type molybdenum transport system ATPase subunit/photorepair protein PhrA